MIVAFSTSSPWTSVGLLEESGKVLWDKSEEAPGKASETCLRLLQEGLISTGLDLKQSSLFISDRGPGSFTGVRVGIVIAKTLAWNFGTLCAGIDAFDLINLSLPVAIPSRKGEFFLRLPGEEPTISSELPEGVLGFGFESLNQFPVAASAGLSLDRLIRVAPEALMPQYGMEPSISTPKRPLSRV